MLHVAHATLNPMISAAATIHRAKHGLLSEQADVRGLIDALTDRVETVQNGDLKRDEAMLLAQAYTWTRSSTS
jgi:hypothetical protein